MQKNLVIAFLAFFLAGCAGAAVRTHSQFRDYFNAPEKAVTVMPIDIKFYKLTAGGVAEQMDEWDRHSDELFKKEIIARLDPSPKIKINILDENNVTPDFKKFLDEENGLYRAISQSIISHTYFAGNTFPLKLKSFDYTFGPDLCGINSFCPTDTILFFSGSRTFWTGGRVFLAAFGILAGAATGVTVIPAGIPDWVAVSLVDAKTGNVLWFRFIGGPDQQIGDLRNAKVVADTVNFLFRNLEE